MIDAEMENNNSLRCWHGVSLKDPDTKCPAFGKWYEIRKNTTMNKMESVGCRMVLCVRCVKKMQKSGYICYEIHGNMIKFPSCY